MALCWLCARTLFLWLVFEVVVGIAELLCNGTEKGYPQWLLVDLGVDSQTTRDFTELYCQNNFQSHLATLRSADEDADFLLFKNNECGWQTEARDHTDIGGMFIDDICGVLEWTDGSTDTGHRKWCRNRPIKCDSQKCIAFSYDTTSTECLGNYKCTATNARYVLCQSAGAIASTSFVDTTSPQPTTTKALITSTRLIPTTTTVTTTTRLPTTTKPLTTTTQLPTTTRPTTTTTIPSSTRLPSTSSRPTTTKPVTTSSTQLPTTTTAPTQSTAAPTEAKKTSTGLPTETEFIPITTEKPTNASTSTGSLTPTLPLLSSSTTWMPVTTKSRRSSAGAWPMWALVVYAVAAAAIIVAMFCAMLACVVFFRRKVSKLRAEDASNPHAVKVLKPVVRGFSDDSKQQPSGIQLASMASVGENFEGEGVWQVMVQIDDTAGGKEAVDDEEEKCDFQRALRRVRKMERDAKDAAFGQMLGDLNLGNELMQADIVEAMDGGELTAEGPDAFAAAAGGPEPSEGLVTGEMRMSDLLIAAQPEGIAKRMSVLLLEAPVKVVSGVSLNRESEGVGKAPADEHLGDYQTDEEKEWDQSEELYIAAVSSY